MTELVKAPEWAERHVLDFATVGTVTRLRRAIRDERFEGDPDAPPDTDTPKARTARSGVVRGARRPLAVSPPTSTSIWAAGSRPHSPSRRTVCSPTATSDATWVDALVDIADRSLDRCPPVSGGTGTARGSTST